MLKSSSLKACSFYFTRYMNLFFSFVTILGATAHVPDWNFWKYLINHEGVPLAAYGPRTSVEEMMPFVLKAVKEANSVDNSKPQHDDL